MNVYVLKVTVKCTWAENLFVLIIETSVKKTKKRTSKTDKIISRNFHYDKNEQEVAKKKI